MIEELENRMLGDVETGSESKEEPKGEEQNVEEEDLVVCLISFLKDGDSARIEVSCYDGILKAKTLINWIGELERYFEYENIQDPNRVRFAMTKINVHATLWWDMIQKHRVDN